jgi:hypothetical protein
LVSTTAYHCLIRWRVAAGSQCSHGHAAATVLFLPTFSSCLPARLITLLPQVRSAATAMLQTAAVSAEALGVLPGSVQQGCGSAAVLVPAMPHADKHCLPGCFPVLPQGCSAATAMLQTEGWCQQLTQTPVDCLPRHFVAAGA